MIIKGRHELTKLEIVMDAFENYELLEGLPEACPYLTEFGLGFSSPYDAEMDFCYSLPDISMHRHLRCFRLRLPENEHWSSHLLAELKLQSIRVKYIIVYVPNRFWTETDDRRHRWILEMAGKKPKTRFTFIFDRKFDYVIDYVANLNYAFSQLVASVVPVDFGDISIK